MLRRIGEWPATVRNFAQEVTTHGQRQQRTEKRDEEAEEGQEVTSVFRLESERLFIRAWEPADRPAYTALTNDAEVTRYVHGGQPFTEAEIDEFFARQARQLAEHGVCMGALCEKATGRIAGIAGTQPLGTTPDFEIGWILARDAWGRGYATAAGAMAMRHVLETLRHPRVVAIISPDNDPSKRVAERLGMTYEARYTGAQLGHRNPGIIVDLFSRHAT